MTEFNFVAYMLIRIVSLLFGLMFSKVQYYKGKRDAYETMNQEIQEVIDKCENALTECNRKSQYTGL